MSISSLTLPRRPLSKWSLVLGSLFFAALFAAYYVGLSLRDLISPGGKADVALAFFSRALSPALTYEDPSAAALAAPLLVKVAEAAGTTLLFAAAAMGLAICGGLVLGYFCSSRWKNAVIEAGELGSPARSVVTSVYLFARLSSAVMRSVHELLWAVLFLSAFGISEFGAVMAIAIPYAGIMAKVFSELIDETSDAPAAALYNAGAKPFSAMLFGVLPLALPDMCSFVLYRFDCALRSSAIMGFFGFSTLGYYISASFENLHYGEVWTYIYGLVMLIWLFDLWSSSMRTRLVC